MRGTIAALSRLALILGAVLLLSGLFLGEPENVALASSMIGTAYFTIQYLHPDRSRFDAVSVYALFSGIWFGLGNYAAFLSRGTEVGDLFWVWQSDPHVALAQSIAAVGVVVPIITNEALRGLWKSEFCPGIPRTTHEFRDGQVVPLCLALAGVTWGVRLLNIEIQGIGGLRDFFTQGGNAAIFILASCLLQDRKRLPAGAPALLLLLVVGEVLWALLFTFLRVHVVWPMAALALPILLRRRVNARFVAFGSVALVLFAVTYEILGSVRKERVVGAARAERMFEEFAEPGELAEEEFAGAKVPYAGLTLLARVSTVNQLSQVGKIVEEDGFYDGETLSYFAFILIPRFIWPEKPIIKPGSWFAERIGRGHYLTGGNYSNAVNMTVPGEFYLNFGWVGAVLGVALLTILFRMLWDGARMHFSPRNGVGHFFALLTIQNAMFVGSHGGILVDLFSTYCILVAVSWGLSLTAARGQGAPARPGMPPPSLPEARGRA